MQTREDRTLLWYAMWVGNALANLVEKHKSDDFLNLSTVVKKVVHFAHMLKSIIFIIEIINLYCW